MDDVGYILLRIQILSGVGCLICGFYGIGYTLSKTGGVSVRTGEKRMFFCFLAMLLGGYLITAGLFPLTPKMEPS